MRDPAQFPELSVASYSTHDTPPLLAFWDELPARDRASLAALANLPDASKEDERERALLRLLFSARRGNHKFSYELSRRIKKKYERLNS